MATLPLPLEETAKVMQAVRMRRFWLAASVYLISIPLLVFGTFVGLIAREPALVAGTAMAVANLAFFWLLRTGYNLRFGDPSLTWLQMLTATTLLMFVAYSFDRNRGVALLMCLVILVFGVFRFKVREYIFASVVMLAGYAAVINIAMWKKPETVDVWLEFYQWLTLACVLPLFGYIGGRMSDLRMRLRRTNDELGAALGTIQRMATHDSLTGLPNRVLFNETLEHAMSQATRHKRSLALLFMDLDRFKNINDTLGHPVGDRVLQIAARRVASAVRESDIVARLGGDEYVVLVEDSRGPADLAEIALKVITAISAPLEIDGHPLALSASIGICTFPSDARDAQDLVANADAAMYRAKELNAGGYCFYSQTHDERSVDRLELEAELRQAAEKHQLRLYYQPKIDMASGRIAGVEALLRWQHPRWGLMLPDQFIPLAEETGLIVGIGYWVVQTACHDAKAWSDAGYPPISVAVNLSARQFRQEDLAERVGSIVRASGLPAHRLELEITESMVMRDPDAATDAMKRLRAMGIRLAMDDFGTGYSSLGVLKRFPIQSLKVDRSFVRDLPHNGDDVAITRAVIAMAHSLRMDVVAEGVEHQGQFDALRREGCDLFQGYFCKPPLTEPDLIRYLEEERRRPATAEMMMPSVV